MALLTPPKSTRKINKGRSTKSFARNMHKEDHPPTIFVLATSLVFKHQFIWCTQNTNIEEAWRQYRNNVRRNLLRPKPDTAEYLARPIVQAIIEHSYALGNSGHIADCPQYRNPADSGKGVKGRRKLSPWIVKAIGTHKLHSNSEMLEKLDEYIDMYQTRPSHNNPKNIGINDEVTTLKYAPKLNYGPVDDAAPSLRRTPMAPAYVLGKHAFPELKSLAVFMGVHVKTAKIIALKHGVQKSPFSPLVIDFGDVDPLWGVGEDSARKTSHVNTPGDLTPWLPKTQFDLPAPEEYKRPLRPWETEPKVNKDEAIDKEQSALAAMIADWKKFMTTDALNLNPEQRLEKSAEFELKCNNQRDKILAIQMKKQMDEDNRAV